MSLRGRPSDFSTLRKEAKQSNCTTYIDDLKNGFPLEFTPYPDTGRE
jgi:hypothetical protein